MRRNPARLGPDGGSGSGPEKSDTTAQCASRRRDAEEPRLALILLFGRIRGGRRQVALGAGPLRVGREVGDEHLRLDDPRASRGHAEIHWSELHRRYWIRDLGSRNGIHLNGRKVTRELLGAGDLLRIGDTVFRVATDEPAAPWPRVLEPPAVGVSRSLRMTFARALGVAGLDAPVVVLGPTGTGKELVVQAIHRASGRTGPLVAVNCAALPSHLVESELFGHEKGAFSGADSARPGLFRAAHAGTLFLDEVGELAPDVQAKLLRAIDTRAIRPIGGAAEAPVNVRIIAATNRDLAEEVRHGRFRADLYARLSESVITLDPLRERPEDLEPLWRYFVAELGQGATLELGGDAFEAMALYAWPFNVRELRQLVRSALLAKPAGGELTIDDLPAAMRPASPDRSSVRAHPPAGAAPRPGRGSEQATAPPAGRGVSRQRAGHRHLPAQGSEADLSLARARAHRSEGVPARPVASHGRETDERQTKDR